MECAQEFPAPLGGAVCYSGRRYARPTTAPALDPTIPSTVLRKKYYYDIIRMTVIFRLWYYCFLSAFIWITFHKSTALLLE